MGQVTSQLLVQSSPAPQSLGMVPQAAVHASCNYPIRVEGGQKRTRLAAAAAGRGAVECRRRHVGAGRRRRGPRRRLPTRARGVRARRRLCLGSWHRSARGRRGCWLNVRLPRGLHVRLPRGLLRRPVAGLRRRGTRPRCGVPVRPWMRPCMGPGMRFRVRPGMRPGVRPRVRLLASERLLAGCLHDRVEAALEGRWRPRCGVHAQELSPDRVEA